MTSTDKCQFCGDGIGYVRNRFNVGAQGVATCGKRTCQRARKSQLQKQRRAASLGEATSIDIASRQPPSGRVPEWQERCARVMPGGLRCKNLRRNTLTKFCATHEKPAIPHHSKRCKAFNRDGSRCRNERACDFWRGSGSKLREFCLTHLVAKTEAA